VSIEEERARQAAAAGAGAGEGEEGGSGPPPVEGIAAATPAAEVEEPTGAGHDGVEAMDEDALLQQALALSMQTEQATPAASQAAATTPAAPAKGNDAPADEAMAEVDDPELALALQMSMVESQPQENAEEKKEDGDGGSA